jgi:chaperonin GroES
MGNFVPLHDRVLVRRVDYEERTPAGILIPDTAKEKPNEGEVLAVGPGARDAQGIVHPPSVGIGDRVIFGKEAGTEIIIEGEDRLVLNESEILGILRK